MVKKKNDTRNDGCLQAVKVLFVHASLTVRAGWLFVSQRCFWSIGKQNSVSDKVVFAKQRAVHTPTNIRSHLVALRMNSTQHTAHAHIRMHTHMHTAVDTFCVDAKMQHKHIRTHTRTHMHAKCGRHFFCVMPRCSTEAYTHA